MVLFPFRVKTWQRKGGLEAGVDGAVGGDGRSTPLSDDNAPDLYLPLMAFVTFVLLTGLLKGIGMRFHPEVLSSVMQWCLVGAALEVAALWTALYMLSIAGFATVSVLEVALVRVRRGCHAPPPPPPPVPVPQLDLVSLTGYKYVGLVVNTLVGLAGGRGAYYLVSHVGGGWRVQRTCTTVVALPCCIAQSLLYTGSACAYWLINTMMPTVKAANAVAGGGGGVMATLAAAQRRYCVVGVGVLQLVLMWWLGSSGD